MGVSAQRQRWEEGGGGGVWQAERWCNNPVVHLGSVVE